MIGSSQRLRGITLIELMVWSGLCLLVVMLAFSMLDRVLRVTRRETDRSQAHLAELRVLEWLTEDLHFANGAGVRWHQGENQPTYLSIHPQSQSLEQQSLFAAELLIYQWDQQQRKLWRRRAVSPPVAFSAHTPLRPTSAQLDLWCADNRVTRRLLAENVGLLQFENVKPAAGDATLPEGAVARNFRVQLVIYSADASERFTQNRIMAIRASL